MSMDATELWGEEEWLELLASAPEPPDLYPPVATDRAAALDDAEAWLRRVNAWGSRLAETRRSFDLAEAQLAERRRDCEGPLERAVEFARSQARSVIEALYERDVAEGRKPAKTIKLPSGNLSAREHDSWVWPDSDELVKWLKSHGHENLVRVTEAPAKDGIKAALRVADGQVLTADGEVVPGVSVLREITFDAKSAK